jgi:hypothetical protein
VFKNLRTSTKLLLLCAAFVGAIALATYGLIKEKLIAIEFASKELVGAQYLQAMRGVYAVILAAAADGSPVVGPSNRRMSPWTRSPRPKSRPAAHWALPSSRKR